MPNWCQTTLIIRGDKKDLNRFASFAKTKDKILDERKFIPYPKKFVDMDTAASEWDKKNIIGGDRCNGKLKKGANYKDRPKDGFNSGGYEWCTENWGTKWGICYPDLTEKDKKKLRYNFDTAWGPCIPVIFKMSQAFPALTFKMDYFEGGMGFKGRYRVRNGNILQDTNENYSGPKGG
ncbi:MAG: hypothetical protein PHI58_06000 [Candidatus Omnitrophica bacterium]|nr:hypothetical protein [Candidatus Omnitrophota bacterium]